MLALSSPAAMLRAESASPWRRQTTREPGSRTPKEARMRSPSPTPPLNARVQAAWQAQLAAAGQRPGLRWTLLRQRHELLPRFAAYYTQLEALPRRLRRHLQRRCKQSLAGVALLLALGQAPALAATINVNETTCTLVNAIRAANTDAVTGGCVANSGSFVPGGADTIVLQTDVALTTAYASSSYGLTGLPDITSAITIMGNNHTIQRVSGPRFASLL